MSIAFQPPKESRLAARVVLFDAEDRILLLKARSYKGDIFWVMPGGGLDAGEDFAEAAERELFEETGLEAEIGPYIWYRRHRFEWNGKKNDQYERYFVAFTKQTELQPEKVDAYVIGHRWWSAQELLRSEADLTPQKLRQLLPPVLRGDYPAVPVDCGA